MVSSTSGSLDDLISAAPAAATAALSRANFSSLDVHQTSSLSQSSMTPAAATLASSTGSQADESMVRADAVSVNGTDGVAIQLWSSDERSMLFKASSEVDVADLRCPLCCPSWVGQPSDAMPPFACDASMLPQLYATCDDDLTILAKASKMGDVSTSSRFFYCPPWACRPAYLPSPTCNAPYAPTLSRCPVGSEIDLTLEQHFNLSLVSSFARSATVEYLSLPQMSSRSDVFSAPCAGDSSPRLVSLEGVFYSVKSKKQASMCLHNFFHSFSPCLHYLFDSDPYRIQFGAARRAERRAERRSLRKTKALKLTSTFVTEEWCSLFKSGFGSPSLQSWFNLVAMVDLTCGLVHETVVVKYLVSYLCAYLVGKIAYRALTIKKDPSFTTGWISTLQHLTPTGLIIVILLGKLVVTEAMEGSAEKTMTRCILHKLEYATWVAFASMLESYCRLGVGGDKCDKPFEHKEVRSYVRKRAQDHLSEVRPEDVVGGAEALAGYIRSFPDLTWEEYMVFCEEQPCMRNFNATQANQEWKRDNGLLFWRLTAAVCHCREAAMITRKYAPSTSHPHGDGRGAFNELESLACGYGPSGESIEGNLTLMFAMSSKDISLKELVTTHHDLQQRIVSMEEVGVDVILKHSLLRCVREHSDYPTLQSVEEKCAQRDIDYRTANRLLMDTITRKAAHLSAAGATALLGQGQKPRKKGKDKSEIHCYKCGKPGVKSNDDHVCDVNGSHKKHAKFDREKSDRLLGKPKANHTIPSMSAEAESSMESRIKALEAALVKAKSEKPESPPTPDPPVSVAGGWPAIVMSTSPALLARKSTRLGSIQAILDTGATMHIFGDKSLFSSLRKTSDYNVQGVSGLATAEGIGTIPLSANHEGIQVEFNLRDCLYVPGLSHNLISCHRMLQSGANVEFTAREASISAPWMKQRIVAVCQDGLWVFEFTSNLQAQHALVAPRATTSASATPETWHKRLAHSPLSGDLKKLRLCVRDLHVRNSDHHHEPSTCQVCRSFKAQRGQHGDPMGYMTSTAPAQLVHVDGAEPSGMPRSREGYRGFYVFIDDFDSSIFVAGYAAKSQALLCYQAYLSWVRATLPSYDSQGDKTPTQFSICVKSDYASELSAGDVKRFLDQHHHGRIHSSPNAPSENSVAERAVQTVKTYGRVIHHDAGFKPEMWFLSVAMAAFVLNFLPSSRNGGVTPYERRWKSTPSLSFLRAPGCLAYYYNYVSGKAKFSDPRAKMGIFVGYDLHSRSYKILTLDTDRIIRSSDCTFDEAYFPLKSAEDSSRAPKRITDTPSTSESLQLGQTEGDQSLRISIPSSVPSAVEQVRPNAIKEVHTEGAPSTVNKAEADNILSQYSERAVQQVPTTGPDFHPSTLPDEDGSWRGERFEMTNYPAGTSRSGTNFRTGRESTVRVLHAFAFVSKESDQPVNQQPNEAEYGYAFRIQTGTMTVFGVYEPGSYKDAITCPDADKWRDSMDLEYKALIRLEAFEIVDKSEVPKGSKVISSKWVFKVKPDKLKSRIVIRGFLQDTTGLSTFAPTVKLVTLRLVIALASYIGWDLHQMDVCNAFLNASLPDENTYMLMPQGYEKEGKVMRLKKALYGLKNLPREWNLELSRYLLKIGLRRSVLDACLFVLVKEDRVVLLIAVHVDDLIMTGKSECIEWAVEMMKRAFKMEDLGRPKTILGMDIHYETDGSIRLCQESYINKLLHRFGNSKPFKPRPTPMEQGCKLTKEDGSLEHTSFPYRELVASLLYLAICTRPDISFTVKELSRFLNSPGRKMIAVAVRCLHYVGTFKTLGLRYHHVRRQVAGALHYTGAPVSAFSDASFADCEGRRSTAGLLLMFNGTAIMWTSKTLKTVALSSQDAELMALSDCARDVIFLQNLLNSVGYDVPKVTINGDNVGSLFVAENPGDHQKSKHIEVRYFFIRQKIEEGRIVLHFVTTKKQLADGLTKALSRSTHQESFSISMGHDEFPVSETTYTEPTMASNKSPESSAI